MGEHSAGSCSPSVFAENYINIGRVSVSGSTLSGTPEISNAARATLNIAYAVHITITEGDLRGRQSALAFLHQSLSEG